MSVDYYHTDAMRKKVALLVIFMQAFLCAAGRSVSIHAETASPQAAAVSWSLSDSVTNIISAADEPCLLFSSGAALTQETEAQTVALTANYSLLSLQRYFLNGDVTVIGLSCDLGLDSCSAFFTLDFASSDKITFKTHAMEALDAIINQKNIANFRGTFGMQFTTPVVLRPYVLYDSLSSNTHFRKGGNMALLKGGFAGTPVKAAGLDASYGSFGSSLLYGASSVDLRLSDDQGKHQLGTIGLSFFHAGCSLDYRAGKWLFSTNLGYTGISADISATFNTDNQKYLGFFFQYLNYNLSGYTDILSFSQNVTRTFRNAALKLIIPCFYCIHSDLTDTMAWKYLAASNLFLQDIVFPPLYNSFGILPETTGRTSSNYRNLQNTAVILPEITYTQTVHIRKSLLDVSVSKLFPLAFNLGNPGATLLESVIEPGGKLPFPDDFELSFSAEDIFPTVYDYLLSGVTVSVVFKH